MKHTLEQLLATSDCLYDRQAVEQAIDRMAEKIRKDFDGQFPVFLTLMNGGMFFGARLALQLGIDAEFDYVHATRYTAPPVARVWPGCADPAPCSRGGRCCWWMTFWTKAIP